MEHSVSNLRVQKCLLSFEMLQSGVQTSSDRNRKSEKCIPSSTRKPAAGLRCKLCSCESEQEIKRRPAAVVRSGWAIKLLSGGPIKAKMCVAGHTQTHQHTPRVCTEAANWHNLSGCHVRRVYENVSCMQIKVIARRATSGPGSRRLIVMCSLGAALGATHN